MMLIPFYIFRYEKEFRKIDGNQKQLSGLRLEYEKIAKMWIRSAKAVI